MPGRASSVVDSFRSGNVVPDTGDARDRLLQVGNNGRLDLWDAALDVWALTVVLLPVPSARYNTVPPLRVTTPVPKAWNVALVLVFAPCSVPALTVSPPA